MENKSKVPIKQRKLKETSYKPKKAKQFRESNSRTNGNNNK